MGARRTRILVPTWKSELFVFLNGIHFALPFPALAPHPGASFLRINMVDTADLYIYILPASDSMLCLELGIIESLNHWTWTWNMDDHFDHQFLPGEFTVDAPDTRF